MRVFVSLDDASYALGVSTDDLHELIDVGELRGCVVGRRTVVQVDDLQDYIAQRLNTSTT